MARLRLLLALGLIGVGTTFGALALSGYYSPQSPHNKISVASTDTRAGAQLVRAKPRQRFVAADTQQATQVALTPPKPKPVTTTPPREVSKPKDKPKEKPRPQQAAAAPWPWNLFSN